MEAFASSLNTIGITLKKQIGYWLCPWLSPVCLPASLRVAVLSYMRWMGSPIHGAGCSPLLPTQLGHRQSWLLYSWIK